MVINSGNANSATGKLGFEHVQQPLKKPVNALIVSQLKLVWHQRGLLCLTN